jgi:hypothetical protein
VQKAAGGQGFFAFEPANTAGSSWRLEGQAFRLTAVESTALRSQNATSNAGRGGQRWAIPNDWICPMCGTPKSDFGMIEL